MEGAARDWEWLGVTMCEEAWRVVLPGILGPGVEGEGPGGGQPGPHHPRQGLPGVQGCRRWGQAVKHTAAMKQSTCTPCKAFRGVGGKITLVQGAGRHLWPASFLTAGMT